MTSPSDDRSSEVVPVVAGAHYIPDHYRTVNACPRIASDADIWDVAHVFDLDPCSAVAVGYVLRAGRKPGESVVKELTKAIEMIQRRIMQVAP